jgi:hypothetical protein
MMKVAMFIIAFALAKGGVVMAKAKKRAGVSPKKGVDKAKTEKNSRPAKGYTGFAKCFEHYITGKTLYAEDYEWRAFPIPKY